MDAEGPFQQPQISQPMASPISQPMEPPISQPMAPQQQPQQGFFQPPPVMSGAPAPVLAQMAGAGVAATATAKTEMFQQPPAVPQLLCRAAGCRRPAAIDPTTGLAYDGCSPEHSRLYGEQRKAERKAMAAAVPPGTKMCALPGCPRPAAPGYDYCKKRHNDDHHTILAGGQPRCRAPGCDRPAAPNPTVPGAFYEGCTREHSLLVGERRRAQLAGCLNVFPSQTTFQQPPPQQQPPPVAIAPVQPGHCRLLGCGMPCPVNPATGVLFEYCTRAHAHSAAALARQQGLPFLSDDDIDRYYIVLPM